MRELHVITDLQFGSCGKGLFAGYLAHRIHPDTIVSAWAPNAGHTFIDADGRKYVHTMIPNGIVSPSVKQVLIGPGSVIDPDAMAKEWLAGLDKCRAGLFIHEAAAVVTQEHRDREARYGFAIGSTMKGVGEAVVQKIRRRQQGGTLNIAKHALKGTPLEVFVTPAGEYDKLLDRASVVMLEGAQGFSLSINQGFYPYCTSRECTTHQLMSDCAIPAGEYGTTVYGVARTFPIRVANRFDADGNQIGTSGPCFIDQQETSWEKINVPTEYTTVTKLPRRVFTFSGEQVRRAIRMNGVAYVFLNFCNYLQSDDDVEAIIRQIEDYAPVQWTGWGPKITDIREI